MLVFVYVRAYKTCLCVCVLCRGRINGQETERREYGKSIFYFILYIDPRDRTPLHVHAQEYCIFIILIIIYIIIYLYVSNGYKLKACCLTERNLNKRNDICRHITCTYFILCSRNGQRHECFEKFKIY